MNNKNDNIFVNLLKYNPNENVSPKENFITESFVYLLLLSLKTDKIILKQFLKLIDENIVINESDTIGIETQHSFTSVFHDKKTIAIPDITIQINNLYIFVEVKVDADINEYTSEKGNFNQIEKYSGIQLDPNKIIHRICTLTILPITSSKTSTHKSITWNSVSSILSKYKSADFVFDKLVNDFIQLLKKEYMAINKVTENLISGVHDLMNFINQLGFALKDTSFKVSNGNGNEYLGYYVEIPECYIKLWIGYYFKSESIVKIQIMNKELIDNIKNNNNAPYKVDPDNSKYILVGNFKHSTDEYFRALPELQLLMLKDWIKSNFDGLNEYVKSTNQKFSLAY